MPQPYLRARIEVNINRSVYGGFRDDNFNLNWTLTSGGSFTTNGDIATLRSSPTFGVGKAQKTVPGTLSTATWPWLIWRAKATNDNPVIRIHYTDTSEQTDTHTNPNFTARNLALTAGKVVQWVQLENTNPGNAAITDWDYVCVAKSSGIK